MDGKIPSGAKTNDFYKTNNIPDRFNNPVQTSQQCYITGNPVVSCVISPEGSAIHERRDESNEWFKGYSEKKVHPLYRTTAQDYGLQRPNVHTMPTVYYTKSAQFSEHLGKTGMYRDNGFNTAIPGTLEHSGSKHV